MTKVEPLQQDSQRLESGQPEQVRFARESRLSVANPVADPDRARKTRLRATSRDRTTAQQPQSRAHPR